MHYNNENNFRFSRVFFKVFDSVVYQQYITYQKREGILTVRKPWNVSNKSFISEVVEDRLLLRGYITQYYWNAVKCFHLRRISNCYVLGLQTYYRSFLHYSKAFVWNIKKTTKINIVYNNIGHLEKNSTSLFVYYQCRKSWDIYRLQNFQIKCFWWNRRRIVMQLKDI